MRPFVLSLFAALLLACAGVAWLAPEMARQGLPVSAEPTQRESVCTLLAHETQRRLTPRFSPAGHFFAAPIRVTLTTEQPEARIHYTLDGSEPTAQSPLYTEPIRLGPAKNTTCVVVKARAVAGDRTSAASVHSYFFDPHIAARFSSYVFSLSTNPDNLYGHERGILVPGRLRALSEAQHPYLDATAHNANYKGRGREWERPVAVEVFSPEGTRILEQAAGLRVFGGVSRHALQKSLRLIARKSYEKGHGKFDYPFFPELALPTAPRPMLAFDGLVLSNGGQDLEDAQLRTPLLTRLAAKAGYLWVAPSHSAAVFLNGAYYGHAFLTTRVDDSFLADALHVSKGDITVLDGGVRELRSSPKYPHLLHLREITDFRRLAEACADRPMDAALLTAVARQVDVDNLLSYYAAEIYVDNRDWPDDQNNVRVWRYSGDTTLPLPELDGRWRYVLYDLDATAMSLWHGMQGADAPSLARVMKKSPIFAALLTRPELAAQFANNLCDMAFAHFTPDKVRAAMAALDAVSLKEIRYAAAHGAYSPPGLGQKIMAGRQNILRFFEERPAHMLHELRETFGYTELYEVSVQGRARCGTIAGENPVGWYFVENPVIVAPLLTPTVAFDHWEVNGVVRRGPTLAVSAQDAVDGRVRVVLATRPHPVPFALEEAYDQGALCGFTLRNVSDAPQSADGLYLSDRLDKPRKYRLKDLTLQPGEFAQFVGKGHRHAKALLRRNVNFNPRKGETVYLRDAAGNILSSIPVR